MVSNSNWKPRKHKRKGRYIFGGYPLGVTPGTGGLPDGAIDGGVVMGEANVGELELDSAKLDNLPSDVAQDDSPADDNNDQENEPQPDEVRDEDPNRQGVIRTVKGAHLVYKRATPDGKFEELWIYNTSPTKAKDEMVVKQAILAGTDIPPGSSSSEDGESSYEMVMLGNATLLHITGLVQ